MNYTTTDAKLCAQYSEGCGLFVKVAAIATVGFDGLMILFGFIFVWYHNETLWCIQRCCEKLVYKPTFRDLPWWHIVSVGGDIATVVGIKKFTNMLDRYLNSQEYSLYKWDDNVLLIGSGCLLTWFSFLRFIRMHHKFSLLFKTIRKAAGDVIIFLVCVAIIFVGFWSCTYIVLGPYHVKFRQKSTTAETLFSITSGDEIFVTLSILQDSFAGDVSGIRSYSTVLISIYVTLFTVLVFNLLIALFNSAYEVVRKRDEDEEKQTLADILRSKLEDICRTKPHKTCDKLLFYLCKSLVYSPCKRKSYNDIA